MFSFGLVELLILGLLADGVLPQQQCGPNASLPAP
jgi:hypothetical protein